MVDLEFAKRLKSIRESLNIKLIDAAERLGFSNYQTLMDIEKGKREVKAYELVLFSRIYYCSIDKLLGLEKLETKTIFKWRNPPIENRLEIERDLLNRCEQYKMLENLLNIESRDIFYKARLEDIRTKQDVQNLASDISKQLDLGRRPAFTLQNVLEQDFNIKILYHTLTVGSSASTIDPKLGNIVIINKNEAPWRQNFDLGHELFHLITWDAVVKGQNPTEITFDPELESKANSFSSALLIPADEVKRLIMNRAKSTDQFSYSDLVDIAIEFGVSTQALLYRLRNLGLISDFNKVQQIANDADLLQENKKKRLNEWAEKGSERFIHLAIRCLRKGLISRGKFTELVEIDRCDIDDYIIKKGFYEEEGSSIEILVT